MKIANTMGIYFSPTEHTREMVQHIAEAFNRNAHLHDLTSYERGNLEYDFTKQDLVVVGAPVYGGRIPALAAERLQQIKGAQTPAIILVSYGNRAYEDALLELKNILEQNQFVIIGAAALIAEHSIVHEVGKDRPDDADWQEIDAFVQQIKQKMEQGLSRVEHIPGNVPYRTYNGIPLTPKGDHNCVKCGFCVRECPAGAIPAADPQKTDSKRCISCMRCVTYCPQQARSVNRLLLGMVSHKLRKKCSMRCKNEFFI